jgi:hypothetical protein
VALLLSDPAGKWIQRDVEAVAAEHVTDLEDGVVVLGQEREVDGIVPPTPFNRSVGSPENNGEVDVWPLSICSRPSASS